MPRISLRQLFFAITAIAVAIVSLKYASETWQALVAILILIAFLAAFSIAFVDRGPRQAFAIGMVIAMGGYGLLVHFDPPQMSVALKWTTNALLQRFYSTIARTGYFDPATGQELVGFDPDAANVDGAQNDASKSAAEPDPPSWGRLFTGITGGRNGVISKTIPDRQSFWYTGHNWFALLFGVLGGHFARFIYLRRLIEQAKSTSA